MFICSQFIPGRCTKNLYLEFDVNFNSYLRINQRTYSKKLKKQKSSVEGKIDNDERRLLLIDNKSKYEIVDKIKQNVCKTEINKYNRNVLIDIVNGVRSNNIEISKDDYQKILTILNFNYDKEDFSQLRLRKD